MDKTFLTQLIDELCNIDTISPSQIPDIDLYMDQVTTFVEDKLSGYKRNTDDKLLTKTMINNYTKDGLIPPPVKKKYSKSHIILLIMIYHLKSVLSITDIHSLFSSMSEDEIEETYLKFISLENDEKRSLYSTEMNKDIDSPLLIALMLTIQANYRKHLAEKIIDNYLKDNNNEQ